MNRILAACLLAGLAGAGAFGQGAQVPFEGFKLDSSLPVEVVSDSLMVDQTTGNAIFEGDVEAVQGELRLNADRVKVFYSKQEESGDTTITRMLATGNVYVTNGKETAKAQRADYDVTAGLIRMEEDVLLTQGQSLIAGNVAVVNLNDGTARVEGRVRTVIQPKQEAAPEGSAGETGETE
ncbi:MAG: lipopolysaccharide transport periplasmic protein LptA [Paracoccaceae bacterium]